MPFGQFKCSVFMSVGFLFWAVRVVPSVPTQTSVLSQTSVPAQTGRLVSARRRQEQNSFLLETFFLCFKSLVPRGQDIGGLLRPSGAEEALMPERRRRCPPSESMRIRGGVSFEAKRPRFRGPPASKRSRGSPQPRKAPGRLHRNP